MYVLHAHWQPPDTPVDQGSMLFRCENSELSLPARSQRRLSRAAKPHPFCDDAESTKQLLSHFEPDLLKSQFNLVTLRLPSGKFGPQPSPGLIHNWDIEDEPLLGLAPWIVTGAWLPPVNAFYLLFLLLSFENLSPQHQLGPQHPVGSQLVLGADLQYWQKVANLVLETLAQQKLLPDLAQVDDDGKLYHARWMPVLDGAQDGPRLARLTEAMPPVCRAAGNPDLELSPRFVIDAFINSMADSLARYWGYDQRPKFIGSSQETAHKWLSALFTNNPKVGAAAAQLRHLSQHQQLWFRNLYISGDELFKVAFRLEAPAQQIDSEVEDGKGWRLYFLLQARDDPSLLITAGQVWQIQGDILNAISRPGEQPQAKFLASLGHAARLFPPLREGLKAARPEVLALSNQEAFDFLREGAPLLEASGFGVLVPPWWNKPGTRLGIRLKMSSDRSKSTADSISKSHLSFDNLVRYKWELSLGDTTLTREEFDTVVALKSPMVQIRGQWVQLDPDQIEAAIRFWEKQNLEAEIDMQSALRMGLGAADEVEGLPLEDVEFEGWLAEWMERFSGSEKLTPLPQPSGLRAQLRPYQQYGFSWLDFLRRWQLGACLADDMGLGKTIQTIAMLLHEKETQGQFPNPVLLICPTSVVPNWAKEVHRFAPSLTTLLHQGGDRLRDDSFMAQAKQMDMVLTSYAVARRDAETLQKIDWFGLILDEAQNIKNPDAKQTRAINKIPTQFKIALTGTPVENWLSELWSIMHFLNPGFLGPRQSFRQKFSLPIERYGDEQAVQRLRKMVSPFILRRVKTDPKVIQDLPDKQEMKVYCNLSQEQATLYEAVVRTTMEDVAQADGIRRRGLVLAMLMKLKQICNHPAQFLHQIKEGTFLDARAEAERSGKLARLSEMLEEAVSVEDRVLIFTQFAEMGHLLKNHLQAQLGVPTQFLYGGTPAPKREKMIKRFQDDPHGPPIFILSLKAGGTGLNLMRANHVFHYDRWWNPAVEDQATDRAFRIGQYRNVQVHKFICVGTLEEMVDNLIESKKALAESVVGGGESWLTEMSTDELRELVALRREVI